MLLVLPVGFLLGFGIPVLMGNHGSTGVGVKPAQQAQAPVADVTSSLHSAAEGTGTAVLDSSDCYAGSQPKSFGTTAGGQAQPTGTTAMTGEASDPAQSTSSGSGSTGSHTGEGTEDEPSTLPPGHPSIDTDSDSKCPRPRSDTQHP